MSDLPLNNQLTPKRMSKMASNQSMNLNHLLNFTLPPRQTRPLASIPRRSRKTGNSYGIWNKERFVNAQYRFVMNPNGDYTVHFADPDIFFQWQDILQVIIPRSSLLASAAATGAHTIEQEGNQTSCPICLSLPVAPRMTKCGHIFCFPCILHYLSTSENKWARCPICFDSVNERQLKCVKWFDGPFGATSSSATPENTFEITPRSGASLDMRLMQRPQITTLALPRSHTWPSECLPLHQAPFHFLPDVYNYAKFMLATPSYLISDLTKDLDELASERRILSRMSDDLGLSFVDGAETRVRGQMAKAAALDTSILQGLIEKSLKELHVIEERAAFTERRYKEESVKLSPQEETPTNFLAIKAQENLNSSLSLREGQAPTSQGSLPKAVATPRNHPRQRRNVNPPPPTTSTYYYYQASSGVPIFLHPLDIRILLSHYHSYSAFPDNITVRVEAFSEGTVDDDLRKKCKYLSHLPEGTDVIFVEADLEHVVGPQFLKNFEVQLKARTTRREEKGKKDDREKFKAEEREREKERLWTTPLNSASRSDLISLHHSNSSVDEFSSFVSSSPQEVDPLLSTSPSHESQRQATGAWGERSFASALHAPPGMPHRGGRRGTVRVEDDWDIDAAWNELQQRSGGKKKRGAKLLLGGGGGYRR